MERFTQRESILLGYSPQKFIGGPSSATKAPFRNSESDVDFHDVFGGPPRRYSIQDVRHGFNDSNPNSDGVRGEDQDDDSSLPRKPWSGLSEKPVFGEESVNRRRYQSDDFFDDIFGGEESSNSPRRSDLRSTPGSRVLSPARPLPPRAEPFGSSSLAPFSLPAKLNKAADLPAFGSGNRSPYKQSGTSNAINLSYGSSTSLSRFSSQSTQGDDELRNDSQMSFRQNSLSHEFSRSSKEFSYMTNSDEMETGGNMKKKDAKAGEPPINTNQFHFSIYKWASKGVPLLMPLRRGNGLRSREKIKTVRCSSSNGRVESDSNASQFSTSDLHKIDTVLNQHTSSKVDSSKLEGSNQQNGSFFDRSTQNKVESCQVVDAALFSIPESKSLKSFQNSAGNTPHENILEDKTEVTKLHSLPEVGLQAKVEKGTPVFTQEDQMSKLRPSRPLSKNKSEEQGNAEITRKDEEKEIVNIANVLQANVDTKNVQKDGKKIISKGVKVGNDSLQGPTVNSGNNLGRNRVKGKVKEFVKIFDEEASSKPKTNVDTGSMSSKSRSKDTDGAYNETTQTNVSIKGTDAKPPMLDVRDARTLHESSMKVEKDLEHLVKQHLHMKSTIHQSSDYSSGEKGVSALSSESLPVGTNETLGNIDDGFDFLIKELPSDPNKVLQDGEEYNDIQVLDGKIRKWSKGKEGNIRSMLSTLQYVLWPESGWKPVPLVDIIEGSAVKRSYQKALLCLHPDKLQQKGAASHQKYIAEKVFDILQEAWDHFNSLGTL